jgi:hypothetical protein
VTKQEGKYNHVRYPQYFKTADGPLPCIKATDACSSSRGLVVGGVNDLAPIITLHSSQPLLFLLRQCDLPNLPLETKAVLDKLNQAQISVTFAMTPDPISRTVEETVTMINLSAHKIVYEPHIAPSTLDMFHEKTLECRLRCLVGNVDKSIIDWCKDRDKSKMNELARQLLGAETIHTPVHHVQYMIAKDDKPELGIAWCRIHKWAYSKAMASSMMKGVIIDTVGDGQQISLVPLRSIPTPTQARAIVDDKIKPYSLGVVPIRTGYGVRCLPTDEARVRAALYPNDTNTGINFARVKTRWCIQSCVAGLSEDALIHIASQSKWGIVLKEFPGDKAPYLEHRFESLCVRVRGILIEPVNTQLFRQHVKDIPPNPPVCADR